MFKLVIVLLLIGVIVSLFSGLFFLFRDHGAGQRPVKALSIRVGLSVALFALLLVGHRYGLISG